MGPASGMLRGTGRRGGFAGVVAVLVAALLPALPVAVAGKDEGGGRGPQPQHAQPAPPSHAQPGGAPAAAPPQDKGARKQEQQARKEQRRGPAPSASPRVVPSADAPAPEPAGGQPTPAKADKPNRDRAKGGPAAQARGAAASVPAPERAVATQPPPTVASPSALSAPPAAGTPRRARGGAVLQARAERRQAARRRAARREAARARTTGPGARRPGARPAVMAPSRWVPAPAPVPAATIAPAAPSEPAAPRRAAERSSEEQSGGGVPIVPVVFNALSKTVAFVPLAVWLALGGLGLLALGLFVLALARDRRARALTREREGLLADIHALEGAVVPALPEALGGLALSVTSAPALGAVTGGDFHDAFPLSGDRVAVLVGDVAGHGRQALADAQLVRHAVRAYLEAGLDPRSALAMTAAVVDERDAPLFASVIVAVHDRRDGTLTFASAGHEPPILVSEHGAGMPPVSGWSPPLGTGLETGRRQTSLPLPEGSAACLITDGLTEARSQGERIGASRVVKWLSALGPGAMSSDVVARLRAEADPGDEDVTVCMLRALTPAAPHAPRIEEAVVESGDPDYLVRFLRDCGLPLADAEEAGEALEAAPDGTRMVASVEIRGGRAVVELAPLRGSSASVETLLS